MRRIAMLLPLSLTGLWVACVSNSSAPPGGGTDAGFTEDSAAPAQQDGAPTIVDAGVDAPADAAPPIDDAHAPVDSSVDAGGSVTVTVIGAAGFESGITIVWNDASGNVVGTSTTGAQGTSTSTLAVAGGMVTALMSTPATGEYTPMTIMGIALGDQLTFLDRGSFLGLPDGVRIAAVPASPPVGTQGYQINVGGYFNDTASVPTTVYPVSSFYGPFYGLGVFGTSVGAASPVMVEATTDTNAPLGYAFTKNVSLESFDDAGRVPVAIAGAWSTSFTQQLVVLENTEDAGGLLPTTFYGEVANGVEAFYGESNGEEDGASPPLGTTVYKAHVGYADFVQASAGYSLGAGVVEVAQRAAAPTADGTMTLDWTSLATLPVMSGVGLNASVPAQPSFTWTMASGSVASSTGLIMVGGYGGTLEDGGTQAGQWTIVSPGTAQSSVQVPKLPAGSPWTPVGGGTPGSYVTVYVAQGGTALPTYAAFRAAASVFTLQGSCIAAPLSPPLPAVGTLEIAGYTSAICD